MRTGDFAYVDDEWLEEVSGDALDLTELLTRHVPPARGGRLDSRRGDS